MEVGEKTGATPEGLEGRESNLFLGKKARELLTGLSCRLERERKGKVKMKIVWLVAESFPWANIALEFLADKLRENGRVVVTSYNLRGGDIVPQEVNPLGSRDRRHGPEVALIEGEIGRLLAPFGQSGLLQEDNQLRNRMLDIWTGLLEAGGIMIFPVAQLYEGPPAFLSCQNTEFFPPEGYLPPLNAVDIEGLLELYKVPAPKVGEILERTGGHPIAVKEAIGAIRYGQQPDYYSIAEEVVRNRFPVIFSQDAAEVAASFYNNLDEKMREKLGNVFLPNLLRKALLMIDDEFSIGRLVGEALGYGFLTNEPESTKQILMDIITVIATALGIVRVSKYPSLYSRPQLGPATDVVARVWAQIE